MREFEIAQGRAAMVHSDDIVYKLGDRELTAHCPTLGQLSLFLSGGSRGGLRMISTLLEFFSDISSNQDWRYIEGLLRDGLDVDILSSISSFLIGEWTGRPTLPSSASGPTPNGTGPPSTESAPSEEQISLPSLLTDSSTPSPTGSSSGSPSRKSGSLT